MATRFGTVYTRRQSKIMAVQGEKVSTRSSPYRRSTGRVNGNKLNSNILESYMEELWSKASEEKRSSCAYFDCLWFSLYREGKSKEKVLQWIKNKNIFSEKYIFVPIICWKHWSLLILCHIGERKTSKTKKRCMLLLDSFHKIDPRRLEPDIRRFVLDIFRLEGRKESEENISDIPLLIPKVPQQSNGDECGMFVLYFIHRFLQSAPESFNMEGYPYFLINDWFTAEDLENFRKEISTSRMSGSTTLQIQ